MLIASNAVSFVREGRTMQVADGMVLEWKMQGRPGRGAGIRVALQIRYVSSADGKMGIVLDSVSTRIEGGVFPSAWRPQDTHLYKGAPTWLLGGRGMVLEFAGDLYPLFTIEHMKPDFIGTLRFFFRPATYLPSAEEGDIVWAEDMNPLVV